MTVWVSNVNRINVEKVVTGERDVKRRRVRTTLQVSGVLRRNERRSVLRSKRGWSQKTCHGL